MTMAAVDVRHACLLPPVPEDGRRRPIEWAGPHYTYGLYVSSVVSGFFFSFSVFTFFLVFEGIELDYLRQGSRTRKAN